MVCSDASIFTRKIIERSGLLMNWDKFPTLGSVEERIGYFASTTEAGELNTVLNNTLIYFDSLHAQIKYLSSEVSRLEREAHH